MFKHLLTISEFKKIEESYHERKSFEAVFGTVIEEYSAFTVAELGEILKENKHVWMPYYCDQALVLGWVYKFSDGKTIEEKTEADARAKMLIYLIENPELLEK